MAKIDSLSIFFPFWNEEENIKNVVENAIPVARKVADKWEIIIIDDGSKDKTLEIAREIRQKEKNVRIISHFPNRGYGAAIKEGLENAKYSTVVFTDGDGQFDFSEVTRFIPRIKKNDLVIGFREKRKDNPIRYILMGLLKIWDIIFFRIRYKDIDCGFKMFKKSAIVALMPLRSEGAMITTEILAKARKKKFRIAEVPVSHLPRRYGDQSGANLWVIVRAVLESTILWMDLRSGRF